MCATLGTALTVEQARLLKRYAPEIWVSYDGDAAGQHAILRALDIFDQEGIRARVLDFPGGMDPDEYVRAYGPQALETLEPMEATAYRMKQEMNGRDLSTQEGRKLPVPHCLEGTDGWQIDAALAVEDAPVFDKPGFGSPALIEYLRSLPTLEGVEFIGLCTDICVITNAMMTKGALPEVPLSVRADCCAGVTPQSHETALQAMRMCQISIV